MNYIFKGARIRHFKNHARSRLILPVDGVNLCSNFSLDMVMIMIGDVGGQLTPPPHHLRDAFL